MREVRTEVLIVGAGPAGLAAAAAAASDGVDVLVVDENPHVGGQIWRARHGAGPRRESRALADRALRHGARFLGGTTVFDACEVAGSPRLGAIDSNGNTLVLHARRVVLATGATERFLPFPGWTLPGVFGVGGLQAMVKGGMDVAGARVVVAGSGPLLLAVAASLRSYGAQVLGVFEQAPRRAVRDFGLGLWRHPRKLAQGAALLARLTGVPRHHDAWPVRAEGDGHLERVTLSCGGRERTLDADYLACGFGLVPATRLAALCGVAIVDGAVTVDDTMRTSVANVFCAGEPLGIGGVATALLEGAIAGHAAAGRPDRARTTIPRRRRERRFATALERAFAPRDELRSLVDDDTVVCRCEDVTWRELRERRDARQTKLETRCGMGPCQGRVCGSALAFLRGFAPDQVRPPLVPVPMRTLAEFGGARRTTPSQTSPQEIPS